MTITVGCSPHNCMEWGHIHCYNSLDFKIKLILFSLTSSTTLWGTSGHQLWRHRSLQRSQGQDPSGVTPSEPMVALETLWRKQRTEAHRRTTDINSPFPISEKQRFQTISCALPWDREAKEGGCVIQLVPRFCTKGRQTTPSHWDIQDVQAWCMCRRYWQWSLVALLWIKDNLTH